MYKWFIALYVDDYIRLILFSYFSTTLGAIVMLGAGVTYISAKALYFLEDSFMVGSYYNLAQAFGLQSLLVNPAYHGFAINIYQWLARKAGRGITCRYNSYYFQSLSLLAANLHIKINLLINF